MAIQNWFSRVTGAAAPLARRGSGRHRFCQRLIFTLLFTSPVFLVGPVARATSAGPAPAEMMLPQGGQEPLRVGVLDLDANGIEDTEARAISERLRIHLGRTGTFEVIERNQMEEIMNEIGFQVSGACDTDECVVQIGQVLGASKMVAGSVSKVGTLYSLQIRLIDIASSRIDHQVFKDAFGGLEEVLRTSTLEAANELAARVSGQAVTAQPTTPPVTNPGQPARLTTATVMIESDPRGGTIKIDGIEQGPTPANLQVGEGTHEITIELAGFRVDSRTIEVIGGQNQTVNISLTEIPRGFLTLTTDPIQCEVLIDGEPVGQLTPLRRFEVYEGRHTIEVRKAGFSAVSRDIVIVPRENRNETITLRASGTARITFRNQLGGAVATITGRESQQTLLTQAEQAVSMVPGDYSLTVKARGYSPWTGQINLADGDNQMVQPILRPKSRVVAGILSIIPGMGQFYSGKGFMGFLMLAGVGGTLGATLGENGNYNNLQSEYDDLLDQYSRATTTAQILSLRTQIEQKRGELIESRDKMNSTATLMTAVWAVNILEAVALMPRLRPITAPGVQSNLSLGTRQGRLALTLSLSFK